MSRWWTSISEPFAYGFFRHGLIVATLAGALCGLIGVLVVLRGMSYLGHGLSHAIFGGFAASTLLGVNVLLGAGVWGMGSALAIGAVTRRRLVGADAAIGVVTTASFALGLVLFKLFKGPSKNFDAALFGNILGVSVGAIWAVVAVSVVAAVGLFFGYRRLLFVTFDPDVAAASGVRVAWVDAGLMLVLAAAVLVTMNVLGVTLIAASLVVPAVTARLLTDSFARMLGLATAIGALSGFVGLMLSYHLDVQSGPAIVLVSTAFFLVAFAVRSSGMRHLPAHAH